MTLKRCCILVGKLKDQGNVFIYLPLLDHIEHFDAEFFTLNGIQFNIVARFATKDHNEILWHKDFFSGLGLHRWIGPKLFFPIQKIILGQTTRPTFITPSLPSQFHHFSNPHKQASKLEIELMPIQEIASMLIAFDRHHDWMSKEVKIRPKSGSMLLYSRKKVEDCFPPPDWS